MIELNGQAKVALRVAELMAIFSACAYVGWRSAQVSQRIDANQENIQRTLQYLEKHCRSDWTLQHQILLTAKLKAANPDTKFPDACLVADEVRRATD
jgi:endonuclease/exonuclease/phosphatase (EEP) superfamily protein YafD